MNHQFLLAPEENLHLALHASQQGEHHAALQYLHAVLQADADNLPATYMLAAEHAELGLFTRAREGFLRALHLMPGLEIARFQLGLLQLQLNETDVARNHLAHLAGQADDPALQAFSSGLLQLCDGHDEMAQQSLLAGIAICSNAPLKGDMQRIVAVIAEKLAARAAGLVTETGASTAARFAVAPEQAHKPVFLGAYRHAGDDLPP